MICTKCKKTFADPLELYDGTVACPKCGKPLAEITELRITAESEERFRLSETYFFHSLELSNKNITKKLDDDDREKLRKEWNECIDNAVRHCRLAASAGHPKAIWRMGFYYDKDYTAVSSTEAQRCRIAYNFYSTLAYLKDNDVRADSPELAMSAADVHKLKVRAANDMLAMLYSAPEVLDGTPKFSFSKNRDALYGMYGDEIRMRRDDWRASDAEKSDSVQGARTLSACLGKTRVPLFGYFYASQDGLKALIDEAASKDRDARGGTIYPVLGKRVYMVYFPCIRGKHVGNDYREVYDTASTLTDYTDSPNGGYLCFINVNTQGMRDRSMPKAVDARLRADGYELFRNMINAQAADGSAYVTNGLTFYADDVKRFALGRRHGYADAVEQLAMYVCEHVM